MNGPLPFYWRDAGPNPLTGTVIVGVLLLATVFLRRALRIAWPLIVLNGAWIVFVIGLFLGKRLWPDELRIEESGLRGRCDFSAFEIRAAEVRGMKFTRLSKGGASVHVFLDSRQQAVRIPIVHDGQEKAYQDALAEFNRLHGLKLD
ncbi:MAG: hypothetical protein ABIS50_00870 [Luteolibacter sp.]|uniref:hypothetical protein n=1 Tax=Luteolibacter sp. TaxID=1962973 RepID=UPI0032662374